MALITRHGRRLSTLMVGALACLAIALSHPLAAHAEECSNWITSGNWFACGGEATYADVYGGINEGGGNHDLCVGLMQHSSSGYTFPVGWDCGSGTVYYEFSAVSNSYIALYNDSGTEYNAYVKSPA